VRARARQRLDALLAPLVPDEQDGGDRTRSELAQYLANSLGSAQRIDYGTGHEAHLLVFLCVAPLSRVPVDVSGCAYG
jgi:hypothetical protein